MNRLLRPRIWPSFRASSGVGPCNVPFRYASGPIPRYRGTITRWHGHLRSLATSIHETSGLEGRRRRPGQEAQEKPVLPQLAAEAGWPLPDEATLQAKEESRRSTLSAPQWTQRGGGSLDLRTRVSKHWLQQQQ